MKRASQGLYSLLARADVGTAEASSSSRHGDVQTNTGMDCQLWRSYQVIKKIKKMIRVPRERVLARMERAPAFR